MSDAGAQFRKLNSITLVLDFCQDLIHHYRFRNRLGDNVLVVLSFNDKSFPGLMGGGVLTNMAMLLPPPLQFSHSVKLNLIALKKVLSAVRWRRAAKNFNTLPFDYSRCAQFPYTFEVAGVVRIQLAMGLIGLYLLPLWLRRRKKSIVNRNVVARNLDYTVTSPFVIRTESDPGIHRTKALYAMYHDPNRSHFPDLPIANNKGFDDC